MKDIKFHEYAMLFPAMSEEELTALRDDIEHNGLVEPIVLLEGKVLDGRNRYTASMMLGIEPATVEYDGDDPLAYVISKNMARRHLDTSQRAMVAAKIANLPKGRPVKEKHATLHVSRSEAAKQMNVSERSVAKATKVLREGSEKMKKAVESGKKTVSSAAKELSQSADNEFNTAAPLTPDDVFGPEETAVPVRSLDSPKMLLQLAEQDLKCAYSHLGKMIDGGGTYDQCYHCLSKLDDRQGVLHDEYRDRIKAKFQ